MRVRLALAAATGSGLLACLVACNAGKARQQAGVGGLGDSEHGRQLIASYGCGACHTIPGVHAARGKVGPPLMFFSQRTMIAGELPNTPQNLTRWIRNPRAVEPNTAMPDLGVSQSDADDIAAYLYTLRGREGISWID